jgi:hypothetical protein
MWSYHARQQADVAPMVQWDEDPVHAHVAYLHLVGDASERDDGPVLKFSMT